MKVKIKGEILFAERLSTDTLAHVLTHIANRFGIGSWKIGDNSVKFQNTIDEYDDEKLVTTLRAVGEEAVIKDGEVVCVRAGFRLGVDKAKLGSFWRYIYTASPVEWKRQEGSISFLPPADRLWNLSTAHITPVTLRKLTCDEELPVVAYEKRTTHSDEDIVGAFVMVSSIGDDIPDDLNVVVQWARENGIEWLNFDVDACEVKELPAYRKEWDEELFGGAR